MALLPYLLSACCAAGWGGELGGVGRDGLRDWYGSALRNFLALRCDKFGLARNFAQKMRYLGFEGPDRALI